MEAFNKLNALLKSLATNAACCALYEKWDGDFCKKELRGFYKKTKDRFTVADFNSIDADGLYQLGFGSWDGKLLLIPIWALPLVADGEKLTCINGSTAIVGQDEMDNDIRFGCVSYGFFRE